MNIEEDVKESNSIASGYKEPLWSGICSSHQYSLDVLKDGVIIDNLILTDKPYYLIGRFKTCDLVFEHPSLSRFHAVLQYCATENNENRDIGWYLMDLESTHGTIVNKKKINPWTFTRIRVGYVLKFGGSSRLYIVNGPHEDKDPLSKHSWTELNEMKERSKLKNDEGKKMEEESEGGCMWGMGGDDDDDESCFVNPETVQKYPHEKLYKDDPKKVIKWFFDREGVEEGPLYNFTNNGFNKSTCVLELPVYGENGNRIIAEVTGSEKKKDMVERCALQACYLLDEIGELYKSGGSSVVPRKDLKYYQDKDYYSSEEDEFYDRTGDLEQKRLQRMRRFGVIEDKREITKKKVEAKDIDSAFVKLQRLEDINNEILLIEEQLEEFKKAMETEQGASEMDEIEKYLEAIQSGTLNRAGRLKLKARIFELQREENMLRMQLKLPIPVTEAMRKTLFVTSKVTKEDEKKISEDVVKEDIAVEKNNIETIQAEAKIDFTGKNIGIIEKKIDVENFSEMGKNNVKNVSVEEKNDNRHEKKDRLIVSQSVDKSKSLKKLLSVPEENQQTCKKKKVLKLILEEDVTEDWVPPQGTMIIDYDALNRVLSRSIRGR